MQMEEERQEALVRMQERERLEKFMKTDFLRRVEEESDEDDEDDIFGETIEQQKKEGSPEIVLARARLTELGHWQNNPYVSRVSAPACHLSGRFAEAPVYWICSDHHKIDLAGTRARFDSLFRSTSSETSVCNASSAPGIASSLPLVL